MKNKSLLSFFTLACVLFVACNRDRDFGYVDGVPGDGEVNSGVTVDTSVKNIDASKYAKARIFPGLACATEPRLNNLTLNMNLKYFPADKEQLRISQPPIFLNSVGNPLGPLVSTGLYAGPGELLIIDVPAGVYSLLAQVGIWTYDASGNPNAQRDPIIYSRTSLSPGRNYLRNLYGGPVYIIPMKPLDTPLPVTFSNVMKMPDFILGETNEAAWQTAIRSSCVPWLELRSENMIFTLSRQSCIDNNVTGLNAIMSAWNDVILHDYYEWMGLETNPADPLDQSPLIPWRATIDITLPPGAGGVAGYPFRALPYWVSEWTNPTHVFNASSWGTFHEIGHNAQQGQYWSWSSLGETTNNLFIFQNAKRIGKYPAKHITPVDDLNSKMAPAVAWASSAPGARNFDGSDAAINDPFARITPFLQIFNKIPADWGYPGQPSGWDFMPYLYKRVRRAVRISTNDQQKRDFLYEAICDYTRRDWSPFFRQWGIAISANLAARMSDQYPFIHQKIWEYNPITQTGGNGALAPKDLWTATVNSWATNEGAANGVITAALDGNYTTYWHSNWSTGTGPTTTPYTITIDMARNSALRGFSIALRRSGTGVATVPRTIIVETSLNGTAWTPVVFASSDDNIITTVNTQDVQNFILQNNINCRYFRLTIPSGNGNGTAAALSEIDVLYP